MAGSTSFLVIYSAIIYIGGDLEPHSIKNHHNDVSQNAPQLLDVLMTFWTKASNKRHSCTFG